MYCAQLFIFLHLLAFSIYVVLAEISLLVQQTKFIANSFFTSSLPCHWVLGALLFPWDWAHSCPMSCHSFLSLLLTNQLASISVAEKHDISEKSRALCFVLFFLHIQH